MSKIFESMRKFYKSRVVAVDSVVLSAVAIAVVLVLVLMSVRTAYAASQETFEEQLGSVQVGNVTGTSPLEVPFITWGGDMPTFYANGNSLTTKPGSIFHKLGLNIKLVNGDDFKQQVRDYMAGKTPFLRSTFDMLGQASEVIASDTRTKGFIIEHLTWSTGGDNAVGRKDIKTVADLKGKTVCLQENGPHVGFLDDMLKSAQLDWSDIKVVWAKDLTGPNGPAEMFKNNQNIDVCFVITPDALALTGKGEGNVKGAKVFLSTAQLSRSIADVYICRKDFYDSNKELVTKFVAGYLKAVEEVIDLKNKYETTGSPEYTKLLEFTKNTLGEGAPTQEEANALIGDCTFVGYGGQLAFFREKGNLHGFEALQKKVLDLAVNRGYAKTRCAFFPSTLDYDSPTFLSYLTKTGVQRKEKFRAEAVQEEIEALTTGALDERTLLTFSINFEPNQDSFSEEQYGAEYKRLVEQADKYANAVFAVRGHSDPTKTLSEIVKAGMKKGILQRAGTEGNYKYSLNGKPLDLSSTKEIIRLIEEGAFDGIAEYNPRETMQAALNLSRQRAEALRDSIINYAESHGLHLDKSQVQPTGVGIKEPFIAKPSNMDEAKQNMRVEFRLIKVSAEATQKSDFDF